MHIHKHNSSLIFFFRDRLKVDSDDCSKMMKLIGKDFLIIVNHSFWHLPFASIKQGHPVSERAHLPVSEPGGQDQKILNNQK